MYYNAVEAGKRIQKLRREKGLTQEQLASLLDVTDRHIRSIENGKKNASIDLLVALSELFTVPLDFIVLGKQARERAKMEIQTMLESVSKMVEKL